MPGDNGFFVRRANEPSTPTAEQLSGLNPEELEKAKALFQGLNIVTHVAHESAQIPTTLAERHPDWPKLKLHYELSPHASAEDFKDFPAWLAEADILLIEGGGQSADEKARIFQLIADTDPSKRAPDFIDNYIKNSKLGGSAKEVMFRSLYGSHKAVGSIDLRGEDLALGEDIIKSLRTKPNYELGDYESVRDDYAAQLGKAGVLQRQREKIMERQFEGEIERLLAERPDLKSKPELHILATMGIIHTSLYNSLERSGLGLEMSRNLSGGSYTYRYAAQLMRHYMHERADEPSEELKDKVYIERIITEGAVSKYGAALLGADRR